jgi:N-methylhydantoinase A
MNLLAERLGLSVADVAKGIVQIADNNMVNALKLVSLNRGYDPREFTLVAFGGGGGMHAVSLARELGVKKVVVPRGSSVFSAWGMMMSDLRRDYFLTKLLTLDGASPCAEAGALLDDLATKARGEYAAEDIDPANVYLHAYVKLRYQHQEHAVEVLLEPGEILANPQHAAAVVERFHSHYERQYTYRLSAPVELVGVHIVAMARVGKLELAKLPIGNLDSARAKKGSRDVDFAADGIHQAAIYDSTKLEPGMKLRGPAVIEDPGTTIVIYPGNAAEIDEYGNTCITNT